MNRHFLYHRKKEREEAIEANFGRLFDSLNEEYRRYENFRTMLPVSHLAEWYSAIRNSASCAY